MQQKERKKESTFVIPGPKDYNFVTFTSNLKKKKKKKTTFGFPFNEPKAVVHDDLSD